MAYNNSVLSQLLKLLPRHEFEKQASHYDGQRRSDALSPHNFSLIGEPSEPMAWSFYSENEYGKINVDILRMVRLVEEMSGQKLVHIKSNGSKGIEASENVEAVFPELVGSDSRGYKFGRYQKLVAPLIEAVKELAAQKDAEIMQLKADNEAMEHRLEALERKLN